MNIEFYCLPNGKQPIRDYLDSLDKGLRSKSLRTIKLLQLYGTSLREPDCKHVTEGIFELRTTMGGNAGRILFFFCVGDKAVLTHGFKKKTRATPRREIERAMKYRQDYYLRVLGKGDV